MRVRDWLKFIGVLVLLVFLVGGCDLFPQKNAACGITNWSQDYYDFMSEWGLVEIYYEVQNKGNRDIQYYEIYLTATCSDGSKYYDWTNGLNVLAAKRLSGSTYIDTAGKKATSVSITDEKYTWSGGGCLSY